MRDRSLVFFIYSSVQVWRFELVIVSLGQSTPTIRIPRSQSGHAIWNAQFEFDYYSSSQTQKLIFEKFFVIFLQKGLDKNLFW